MVPRRIYVETDPVVSQIKVALGDSDTMARLDMHDTNFSYSENLVAPDCGVPVERYLWLPLRQTGGAGPVAKSVLAPHGRL